MMLLSRAIMKIPAMSASVIKVSGRPWRYSSSADAIVKSGTGSPAGFSVSCAC
jgi:hypothetical protein